MLPPLMPGILLTKKEKEKNDSSYEEKYFYALHNFHTVQFLEK